MKVLNHIICEIFIDATSNVKFKFDLCIQTANGMTPYEVCDFNAAYLSHFYVKRGMNFSEEIMIISFDLGF